ncbi:hypothetical protein EON65_41845 [archaeon]|nr:MAG: hypothetical protein EON65_41845 [archaeon]
MTGDLWGPLLVCLLLSIILSLTAPADSASIVFAAVFVIVWFGAAAVTINAQLLGMTYALLYIVYTGCYTKCDLCMWILGGSISFFQSVCILGYCVFPLTLSALACFIMRFIFKNVSSTGCKSITCISHG